MKKVISTILSLAIIFGSITCMFSFDVSAEGWEPKAESWGNYASGSVLDGGAAATTSHIDTVWNSVSDSNDYDFDADGTSIKINTNQQYVATVLPTLEKNSTYRLSFRYYLPEGVTVNATTTEYMRNIGVSLKGMVLSGSGNNITPASFVKRGSKMNGASGVWQKYTINFSTGENTEFVFGGTKLSAVDAEGKGYFLMYLDDFSLVKTGVEWNVSAENWGNYASGNVLDGSKAETTSHTAADWNSVSKSSDYDYDLDGTSVRVNTNQQYVASVLPTLEKNKEYKLSFKYYLPEGVTKSLDDGYMRNIGISLKGTTLSGSGNNITPTSFVQKGGRMDGASGTWHEYSIKFFTGENTDFVFGGTKLTTKDADGKGFYVIYFDDFSLKEVVLDNYYENPENWGEVNGTYTVGDAIGTSSVFSASDNVSSVNSNNSVFNDSTWGKLMAIKIQDLKQNTTYKLSFKHNVPVEYKVGNYYKFIGSGIYTSGTTTVYSNNSFGINITGTVLANDTSNTEYTFDAWNDYSVSFTTGTNTDVYFITFLYANAIYFDEFSVTELSIDYYEQQENWHFYGEGQTIGGTDNLDAAWHEAVTNIADKNAINEQGSASIKINTNQTAVAIKLNDVQVNKRYILTFSYYVPTTTKSALDAWMNSVGIYKSGTSVITRGAIGGEIPPVAGGTNNKVGEVEVGAYGDATWHNYTLDFTTTEDTTTDLYFAFRGAFAAGFIIYLDDICVTEAEKQQSTISFVTNNETSLDSMTGIIGSEITNLPVLESTFDNAFDGWYIDDAFETKFTSLSYPKDDVTLYAKWSNESGISTAYNNSAALRVGTNSSTGKNGLRIYNSIDVNRMDLADIVEFGSIAVRESNFKGEELTIDMKGTPGIGVGVAYNEEDGVSIFWDTTDDHIYFTSYLTGIDTKYYGENFLIRTYAIDSKGNIYYGDTVSVSVFEIAYSIDCGNTADGSAQSDADITAFNAFANFGDNNFTEYFAWLVENNLSGGNLSGF